MKKLIAVLTALVLSLSLATAQSGEGPGPMDGSGPHGGFGLWAFLDSVELPDEQQAALDAVLSLRADLRESRTTWLETHDNLEGWYETEADNIASLRENVGILRDWFRENRPDRPAPVMTGEMFQRKLAFKANSDDLIQLRKRLHELNETDPNSEECEQIREQIRSRLGERKGLLREQRHGEDGQSGDGNGKRGG